MSLRTNLELLFQVGFDNDLDDAAFSRDIQQVLDSTYRCAVKNIKLAALEADTSISLDDVAQGRILYMESDVEITFKLNGVGTTAIKLSRPVDPTATQAASTKAYCFLQTEFTQLHLTGHASSIATVKVCIVGDLAA